MTYVASHAGIFELIFADLLLSESLQILAPCPSLPFSAVSFENKEGGEGGLHNILGEIVREGGLMGDLRY